MTTSTNTDTYIVKTKDSYLYDLADAIRAKLNTTQMFSLDKLFEIANNLIKEG